MAGKFKIGDKVKVATSAQGDPYDNGFRKGMVGEITDCPAGMYPYEVISKHGYHCWFKPQELVLIKRKSR